MGAGTDPAEGAALAVAVIEFCRKLGAKVAGTTHYGEMKLYAMRTEGVMNASCEFDVETLRPTYRLLIGVPGRSNAFAISEKLGLDPEIIDSARERISSENQRFEDVVSELETARQNLEKEYTSAHMLNQEAERLRQENQAYRERLESKMREVLASTTIDEARILTETAIFADKIAVDEETVRLHSHLSQLRDMLQGDEPVGRKLDFLIQEINRECNTIGSKCSDLTITQDVVNMKAEVEKIREQVQNIE